MTLLQQSTDRFGRLRLAGRLVRLRVQVARLSLCTGTLAGRPIPNGGDR